MKTVGIILLILGVFCFSFGIYKYSVYENYESSFLQKKNAYVGGDAYNYIINANYFTGWSVLGACSFVSGIILIGIQCLLDELANLKYNVKSLADDVAKSRHDEE